MTKDSIDALEVLENLVVEESRPITITELLRAFRADSFSKIPSNVAVIHLTGDTIGDIARSLNSQVQNYAWQGRSIAALADYIDDLGDRRTVGSNLQARSDAVVLTLTDMALLLPVETQNLGQVLVEAIQDRDDFYSSEQTNRRRIIVCVTSPSEVNLLGAPAVLRVGGDRWWSRLRRMLRG